MNIRLRVTRTLITTVFVLYGCISAAIAGQDDGYDLTSELWAKAILKVPNNPVTLVWKAVGTDITPSGAQVVSGYFYADPADFAYGSIYNPEVFVKVYIDPSGWTNIAFNHVTVDNVDISSAHGYEGSADKADTVTLDHRLAEHQYDGVIVDASLTATHYDALPQLVYHPVAIGPFSTADGYILSSQLWANAILQVSGNPVTLAWKEVGADTTPSGDRVVSGYFYADPNDFAYGSVYNPEIFVKVYIASNGWANMAFNHVTVDAVSVDTAYQYTGAASKSGNVTLDTRLLEHEYTDVAISEDPDTDEQEACYVDQDWILSYKWEDMPAYGSCMVRFHDDGTLTTDNCLLDSVYGSDPETGKWTLLEDQKEDTWIIRWGWDAEPDINFQSPVYGSGSCTAVSGVMYNQTAPQDQNEGEWYLDMP